MAWTSWAVSSGSKICSKQSGNYAKRAAIYYKVMCSSLQTQTPPILYMRVRTFSGLHGRVNSLCNMVNRSHHDFHSTVVSATSEKVLPKGEDMFETFKDKASKVIQFAQKETRRFGCKFVGMVNNRSRHDFDSSTVASSSTSVEKAASPPILPMGEDMFENFTDKAKEVIKFAQMETRPFGYKFVGTEMILLGLIGDDVDKFLGESTDIAEVVLHSMDISLNKAREKVKELFGCGGLPSLSVDQIPFRPSALRAFERSLAEAQKIGQNYIGSEHLLLGLLEDEDASLVLEEFGVCPAEIRLQVERMLHAQVSGDRSSGNETPTLVEYLELADEKQSHPSVQGNNKMLILEDEYAEFGVNLTERVRKTEWLPVVERKPLINTLIQILGRRSKNNAFLVGQKGVGKSSVLQGLVQRIRDLAVPDFLSKKKVIFLNVHAFAENRLQNLMEEIKERNDIIIYIDDEVSKLSEGDIKSFSDITMPALVRGGVQCVISATPDAYLRMKKYPELERLFQPIKVPAATVVETIKILKGCQNRLEDFHEVRYTDEALVAAVHMSDQFLRHGYHPVKAFELANFAGAFVYKKEIHLVRDQLEVGHKMSMSQIKENIKCMPPTVTKADIEDVALELLRLNVIVNQFFYWEKSYHEFYEALADI